ncbi:Chemotaxis protein CheC flagellar motor switch protein [Methanonatronarchaeum thermophilum]|uniref:Chemotaxis protein CheC flagellar motor switch protein n=1 Tax=Methanonatronarchaeum thermophilum TaxID=1927129 RepID=A0A1Y3GAD9_9EURY|nr:chemotaxis protein CheC [Methanonatronarchaeum thermophilum]OUJ18210.1 Chemotaxis protein CheC flagellar motor switch protein [Methanonatronarchaeum thermophilum]
MKIQIDSLGSFNRMAMKGADTAAKSLSMMVNQDIDVEITKVDFIPIEELSKQMDQNKYRGVSITYQGGLQGGSILVFPPKGARKIVKSVMPLAGDEAGDEFGEMEQSAIQEIGNIMTSGFIDGWADMLQTDIDISTPNYIEDNWNNMVEQEINQNANTDFIIAFVSKMKTVGKSIKFYFYMFPEPNSLENALNSQSTKKQKPIDTEGLRKLNEVTKTSANQISENLSMMTQMPTKLQILNLNFVPIEEVGNGFSNGSCIANVFKFEGSLSGYVMIKFSEKSAKDLTTNLLGKKPENGFGEMEQSAIQEIGNIMTSGFIDGWADMLQTDIDISTPNYMHDMGKSIVQSVLSLMAEDQKYVFLFDTKIDAADQEFESDVYVFFENKSIRQSLNKIT